MLALGIPVILLSWLLNAFMDAIDHGKGAQTLGLLWHALKTVSYGIPFAYILWLTHAPIYTILVLLVALKVIWELTYRFLRHINFEEYDKL